MITKFFEQLAAFLTNIIAPNSNALDFDEYLLKNAFQQLSKIGGLKLLIPESLGGLGGGRADWIEYNMQMAKYSGALLFLQAQHQYAISQLLKLPANQTIQTLLKSVAESNESFGIALAAKRQLLHVQRKNNGFIVSGKIIWVTGLHYLRSILLSFDLDEKIYYTLLPFQYLPENKSLSISPKIETAAFNSTNTVSITLENYFVIDDEIITSHLFQEKNPMEHPAVYNFAGAAKALLELASKGKYHNYELAKQHYQYLIQEWNNFYIKITENVSCPFTLRAQGQQLAEHCLTFARMVCGAESLLATHPINRIGREIWQYSIAGYSEDQLKAYLETKLNYNFLIR